MITIRPVRAIDIAHYSTKKGLPVPPRYFGYAADLNGKLSGIGLVLWPARDEKRRCFVMAVVDPPLRQYAVAVHRLAVRTLRAILPVESHVYVLRDDCEETSCAWLTRLGFHQTDELIDGKEVWQL